MAEGYREEAFAGLLNSAERDAMCNTGGTETETG